MAGLVCDEFETSEWGEVERALKPKQYEVKGKKYTAFIGRKSMFL
jgi:hypothetical protein